MKDARLLLREDFMSEHAQLEFGEVGGVYPEWDLGSEPVVANQEKIVVATLPDFEGTAVLEVWAATVQPAPQDKGVLVHDGVIRLSGDEAEAGTYLGGHLKRVRVGRGQHRVRVFVDEPGRARKIVFLVAPAEAP